MLLLPVYLLLVFGLLQMGQLAIALLVTDYAASAIARQAVQEGSTGSQGSYNDRFQRLLTVGMKNPTVQVVADSGLLSNVTVHACAQIDAMPFIGQIIGRPLASGLGTGGPGNCQNLRAFAFSGGAPYAFTVHGKATARMNYRP